MPNFPDDKYFEKLILDGIIEPSAIDMDTGEMLYEFTSYAMESMPDLKRQADEEFHSFIMFFWENGFISMNVMLDSPTVTITPKALDKDEVAKLPKEYQSMLKVILEALRVR